LSLLILILLSRPRMFSLSSSEDYFLEEADSHIQANLEDAVVQQALKSGRI
jgi:hypothetical protein